MVVIQYPVRSAIAATTASPELVYFSVNHTSSQGTNALLIYMRQASWDLMDHLSTYKFAVVTGSPGSGKSLTTWFYVLMFAEAYPDQRIVWIDDTTGVMYLLENNQYTCLGPTDTSIIQSDDVVVFDQISSNENYLKYLQGNARLVGTNGQLILITSLKINLKNDAVNSCNGSIFTMPPWVLDDYKHACDNPAFFNTVLVSLGVIPPPPPPARQFHLHHGARSAPALPDPALPVPVPAVPAPVAPPPTAAQYIADKPLRDALLEDKYFYSGYSCRYMFGSAYHVKYLCKHIVDEIASISHLADAMTGNVSSDLTNSLFVDVKSAISYAGITVPVSQYALKAMRGKLVGANFIKVSQYAAEHAADNGLLDGQIFEMDVIKAITLHSLVPRIKFVVMKGARWVLDARHPTPELFCNTREIIFHRTLEHSVPLQVYQPNNWFFPRTTPQGGFNLAQLYQRTIGGVVTNVLRFIQVTRADSPRLRLDFMATFADSFNAGRTAASTPPPVYAFEVMIMTTVERAVNYKVSAPTHAVITGQLPGWDIGDLQVTAFKRAHQY